MLAGLLAISIPIVIHLLNLNKVRKVEFSTLRFLKDLQKTKMKRIRLRQLLLLALRILAIAFLVLAFANPVLRSFSGSYSGKSSSVIIMDNSPSMSAMENKPFENAKNAALGIINSLDADDEVFVVLSSDLGNASSVLLPGSLSDCRMKIDSAKIAFKTFSAAEGLTNARLLFEGSSYPVKDLFIITDLQQSGFIRAGSSASIEEQFSAYVIDAGIPDLNNIAIDSGRIISGTPSEGMKSSVLFNLGNYGVYSKKDLKIDLTLEGRQESEIFTTAGSFETLPVELDFRPQKTGHSRGTIRLSATDRSDDQIIQDNQFYFAATVPPPINIGLLGSETEYVKLALESVSNSGSGTPKYNISNVTGPGSGVDVLIVSGKNSFDDAESESIREFMKSGGGVLLFPGENINTEEINNRLFAGEGGIRFGGIVNTESGSAEFSRANFSHPVISGVFRNKSLEKGTDAGNIEAPDIRSYFRLMTIEGGKNIISLANGDPFIAETDFGKGRAIIFAVPPGVSGSDFPLKSLFVPLVTRSADYLAGVVQADAEKYVGDNNVIEVPGLSGVRLVENPEGKLDTLDLSFGSSGKSFFVYPYSSGSSMPGHYTAMDSSGNTSIFTLNTNPAESNLSRIEPGKAADYLRERGVRNVYTAEWNETAELLKDSAIGSQLWMYFLILAMLMLAAETFLARRLEKGNS